MAKKKLQLEVVRVGQASEREKAFAQAVGLIRSRVGSGRAANIDQSRLPGKDERGDNHAP